MILMNYYWYLTCFFTQDLNREVEGLDNWDLVERVARIFHQAILLLLCFLLGVYKPRIRCYETSELCMKFERCLDSESMFSDVFYAIISGLIVSWKNVFMYRCNSFALYMYLENSTCNGNLWVSIIETHRFPLQVECVEEGLK